MAIDGLKFNNTIPVDTEVTVGRSSSNAQNIYIPLTSENSSTSNIDELSQSPTEANANSSNNKSLTRNEIYNMIAALCIKNGIKLEEAKQIGLLEKMFGCTDLELLKMSSQEINDKIKTCLEPAIEYYKNLGEEIDLYKLATKANDYRILIKEGWNIAEFEKKQKSNQESVYDRLERFFGIKDFAILSEEKQANYIQRYFVNYFNELKEKKNLSDSEVEKILRKDLSRLLVNTPDEEKLIFNKVFASIKQGDLSNHDKIVLDSLASVLSSFETNDSRMHYADNTTTEDLFSFEFKNSESYAVANSMLQKNRSYTGALDNREITQEIIKEFEEKNKEIILRIKEKELSGVDLTPEELEIKNILEKYSAIVAGENWGTANNENISENQIDKLLNLIDNQSRDLEIYREILEQTYKTSDLLKEQAIITPEKFKDLMDKATNGNYSIVADDIARNDGVKSELNPPVEVVVSSTTPGEQLETVSSGKTSVQTSTSYVQVEQAQKRIEEINTQFQAQENENSALPKGSYIHRYNDSENGLAYVKEAGTQVAIKTVFNNQSLITNNKVINYVLDLYKSLNLKEEVQSILQGLNSSGLILALKNTSTSMITKLDGKTVGNSFYEQQLIDNAKEEAREKEGLIG